MNNKWSDFFTLMEEATRHPNRSTFAKKKRNAYNAAKRTGLLDTFFPKTKWSKEAAIAEAEKYATRSLFKEASPDAYKAMARNGLLDYWFPRRAWRTLPYRGAHRNPMKLEDLLAIDWIE